jgi:hypothetical protein
MATPPDQAPAPADPKALLRHARALLGSVHGLESGLDRARQQVGAAFHDLREEMVRRDLANIAVERLNDTTGGVLATAPAAADRPRRASGFR